MLNEILQQTLELELSVKIAHRRTLRTNYNLHLILGEIYGFLTSKSDEIWEYIIKYGEKIEIDYIESKIEKTNRKDIYLESKEIVIVYIDNLTEIYNEIDDLLLQNYFISLVDELKQLYSKLESVCPEMI